jgi:hypothetical protein
MPSLSFFCKVLVATTLYLLAMPCPAAAELAAFAAAETKAEAASRGVR